MCKIQNMCVTYFHLVCVQHCVAGTTYVCEKWGKNIKPKRTRTYAHHRNLRPTGFDINRTLRYAARTLQTSTRSSAVEDKLTASRNETAES